MNRKTLVCAVAIVVALCAASVKFAKSQSVEHQDSSPVGAWDIWIIGCH
jgi:type IV secretory pathway protease TraF